MGFDVRVLWGSSAARLALFLEILKRRGDVRGGAIVERHPGDVCWVPMMGV